MGLRRYVLWLRLRHVVACVAIGYTAAHEAGFADSAHLSRTFRSMFGLPLSSLFGATARSRCPWFRTKGSPARTARTTVTLGCAARVLRRRSTHARNRPRSKFLQRRQQIRTSDTPPAAVTLAPLSSPVR
jgi:AraC-like DNA-binding protein